MRLSITTSLTHLLKKCKESMRPPYATATVQYPRRMRHDRNERKRKSICISQSPANRREIPWDDIRSMRRLIRQPQRSTLQTRHLEAHLKAAEFHNSGLKLEIEEVYSRKECAKFLKRARRERPRYAVEARCC